MTYGEDESYLDEELEEREEQDEEPEEEDRSDGLNMDSKWEDTCPTALPKCRMNRLWGRHSRATVSPLNIC